MEFNFTNQVAIPEPVPYTITREDMSWHESTSTSPSRRSLILYNILTRRKVTEEDINYCKIYGDLFASIITLTISTERVLPRWTNIHSILIPKDETLCIQLFRLLHLYEGNINLSLRKIIAQILRDDADKIGLADEQWEEDKNFPQQTWESRAPLP